MYTLTCIKKLYFHQSGNMLMNVCMCDVFQLYILVISWNSSVRSRRSEEWAVHAVSLESASGECKIARDWILSSMPCGAPGDAH